MGKLRGVAVFEVAQCGKKRNKSKTGRREPSKRCRRASRMSGSDVAVDLHNKRAATAKAVAVEEAVRSDIEDNRSAMPRTKLHHLKAKAVQRAKLEVAARADGKPISDQERRVQRVLMRRGLCRIYSTLLQKVKSHAAIGDDGELAIYTLLGVGRQFAMDVELLRSLPRILKKPECIRSPREIAVLAQFDRLFLERLS
mmetsp:Transcript_87150/g.164341  ORF Transcript_87150/g.164341 Transcript_87150/m.164341 type:complete len:198 (-) Transcript_87150:80-673(-)